MRVRAKADGRLRLFPEAVIIVNRRSSVITVSLLAVEHAVHCCTIFPTMSAFLECAGNDQAQRLGWFDGIDEQEWRSVWRLGKSMSLFYQFTLANDIAVPNASVVRRVHNRSLRRREQVLRRAAALIDQSKDLRRAFVVLGMVMHRLID